MHPTIDEQLEGIARLLGRVAERHPDDPSSDRLQTAAGTLRRIAGSWTEILPHLTWDNRAMEELFERHHPDLPDEVRARLRALSAEPADPLSARSVEERNRELRAMLAAWVRALSPEDGAARAAITGHVRDRIAREPSSGRRKG